MQKSYHEIWQNLLSYANLCRKIFVFDQSVRLADYQRLLFQVLPLFHGVKINITATGLIQILLLPKVQAARTLPPLTSTFPVLLPHLPPNLQVVPGSLSNAPRLCHPLAFPLLLWILLN